MRLTTALTTDLVKTDSGGNEKGKDSKKNNVEIRRESDDDH